MERHELLVTRAERGDTTLLTDPSVEKTELAELLRCQVNESSCKLAHWAVWNGKLSNIPVDLITADFLRMTVLNAGWTVAHYVAMHGDLDLLPRELVTQDLIRLAEPNGSTVAHLAAQYGHCDQIPANCLTPEILGCMNKQGVSVAQKMAGSLRGQLSKLLSRVPPDKLAEVTKLIISQIENPDAVRQI